jgi:hypothetical protein
LPECEYKDSCSKVRKIEKKYLESDIPSLGIEFLTEEETQKDQLDFESYILVKKL